jgi:hypothetical protein
MVDQARRTGNRLRLLYHFAPRFERITPGALWADTRLGLRYLQLLDGCAAVSDVGWIREPTRSIGGSMPCPVRVFGNDERDEAVAWLTSLPAGDHLAVGDVAKAYIGGVSAALWSVAKVVIMKGAKHNHRRFRSSLIAWWPSRPSTFRRTAPPLVCHSAATPDRYAAILSAQA